MEKFDYRMPLYIQLQDVLLKRLEEEEYLPGEKLPSERQMAELYGINRMTVKNAVNALVEKGYLYRVKGKGTFVAKKDTEKLDLGSFGQGGNNGITALLHNTDMELSNVVLAAETVRNCYLSGRLGLGDSEDIFGLHRIRKGDGVPLALEYTYVPKKYFEDIEQTNFSNVSLYDYMGSRGHMPCHFIQKLIFVKAGEKEASLMGMSMGQALYYFEYIGADEEYNVVEYTESYMNPQKVKFRFEAAAGQEEKRM